MRFEVKLTQKLVRYWNGVRDRHPHKKPSKSQSREEYHKTWLIFNSNFMIPLQKPYSPNYLPSAQLKSTRWQTSVVDAFSHWFAPIKFSTQNTKHFCPTHPNCHGCHERPLFARLTLWSPMLCCISATHRIAGLRVLYVQVYITLHALVAAWIIWCWYDAAKHPNTSVALITENATKNTAEPWLTIIPYHTILCHLMRSYFGVSGKSTPIDI